MVASGWPWRLDLRAATIRVSTSVPVRYSLIRVTVEFTVVVAVVDCFEGHDNFHAAEVDCGKDDHFFHSSYYRVSENHQSCLSHYQKYFLVHQCRYGVDLLGQRCRASSHVRTRGIVIRPLGGDFVGAAVQRSYSTGADARRSTLRLWAAVSGERRVLPVTTFFLQTI